ncbi:hypothetical protein HK096_008522 [Nowakowskiella sp. JEL0078]|nr:hypothetical protein HK096_008522 [Nowakowskiella sp. JEL0078]
MKILLEIAVNFVGCYNHPSSLPAGWTFSNTADYNSCITYCSGLKSTGCAFTYGQSVTGNETAVAQCFTAPTQAQGLTQSTDATQCRQLCQGSNSNCAKTIQYISVFQITLVTSTTSKSTVVKASAIVTDTTDSTPSNNSSNLANQSFFGVPFYATAGVLVFAIIFVVVFAVFVIRRKRGSNRFNNARNKQFTINLMDTLSLGRTARNPGLDTKTTNLPPPFQQTGFAEHRPESPQNSTMNSTEDLITSPQSVQVMPYQTYTQNNVNSPYNPIENPHVVGAPSRFDENFRKERADIAAEAGIRRSIFSGDFQEPPSKR